jgi:hypothetical protein
MENTMDIELTPDEIKKANRKVYNKTTYANRLYVFKLRHIFETHPYIQQNHADEIRKYIQQHGEAVDANFIEFLRTFIIRKPRTSKPKDESTPRKKYVSTKAPKEILAFL